MTRTVFAFLMALTPVAMPATAQSATPPLLCLGTDPSFLLSVRPDGGGAAEAMFDYLGDGTFAFAPPPQQGLTFSAHALETAGGPIETFFQGQTCAAIGMSFPITVEMNVPAGGGSVTFVGCCLWQDG